MSSLVLKFAGESHKQLYKLLMAIEKQATMFHQTINLKFLLSTFLIQNIPVHQENREEHADLKLFHYVN